MEINTMRTRNTSSSVSPQMSLISSYKFSGGFCSGCSDACAVFIIILCKQTNTQRILHHLWFGNLTVFSVKKKMCSARHRWVIYTTEMNGKNTMWEVDGSMVPAEWYDRQHLYRINTDIYNTCSNNTWSWNHLCFLVRIRQIKDWTLYHFYFRYTVYDNRAAANDYLHNRLVYEMSKRSEIRKFKCLRALKDVFSLLILTNQ